MINEILSYYSQHPYFAVVLAILIIITLFVCYKAGKASAKHSKETNKIMNTLKEENKLRNNFAILSEDLVNNSNNEDLFKGIGLNLQKRVSDCEDMLAEFDKLNIYQKYIYCLYTFYEDSSENVINFFRANTKPLTSVANEAVAFIIGGDFSSNFTLLYEMYDEDNEEISYSEKEVFELNEKTAPTVKDGTVCKLAGEYIKNNFEYFK